MPTFESLKDEYRQLIATMTLRPDKIGAVNAIAKKIIAARARYEAVEKATDVPWRVIGAIHAMECGLSFKQHLHNGDPLTARTHQVPAGRPVAGKPPFTWEESAIDALKYDGLDEVKDWSPERTAYELEGYNGWGYRLHHPNVKSPYLWSYTNHYVRGKYTADSKWDPGSVSGQSGAMAILAQIDALLVKSAAPVPAPTSTAQKVGSAAGAVVVGGAGATVAVASGMQWWEVLLIGGGIALIAAAGVLILRGRK